MTIRCPFCLEPIELTDGELPEVCPNCDKSLQNHNPEGALPLGTRLGGRYTVGEYLSADGDGLAYRGVENEARRFVLIKEYFPVTLCNGRSPGGALMPKEGREVLFKTSRMDFQDLYVDLRNLTPTTGLSQILDVLEENNTVYAVEENEKGMTLTHYLSLRARPLTPNEARELLAPVMEGVTALHKAGLIHRGICPDNILLPIDGEARLTGYGTLALRTGGSELKSQLYTGYAAPEQYSAAEFSGRYTDVYALAAVTYRLVTGQTPIGAPQRQVRDSLESAHSLEMGVPSYFSQVLSCAMRLDPAKRMQTVPELLSALNDPSVASAMFDRGENQISTKKILGASLVVIFVLVILLLWSLLRPTGEEPDAAGEGVPSGASSSQEEESGSVSSDQDDIAIVPDFVGKNYANEIKNSDVYQSYRIVMTEDYSSEVAKGLVISQEPLAGTLQTEDSPIVQIVVSKGPKREDMPNIIGFTQDNAIKLLDAKGIQYRMEIMVNDGQYAAGCVARCELDGQDLAPGVQLDTGTDIVTVYIAGERDDTPNVSIPPAEEGDEGQAEPQGEEVPAQE